MRALVTGAAGQVGREVVELLGASAHHECLALNSSELDISVRERVLQVAGEWAPEVIINAAAFTAVDASETQLDKAFSVNALGPRNLCDRDAMEKLPQRLVNIRAADRFAVSTAMRDAHVGNAIEREQAGLDGRGRVLVRASGTEPLIRVMVEAPTEQETDDVCGRLTAVVKTAIAGT